MQHHILSATGPKEEHVKITSKISSAKTDKLITPEFLLLLMNLYATLNEERKALLDYRHQINKALQKDFENVIAEQQAEVEYFLREAIPPQLEHLRTIIICPANQTSNLVKLMNGNDRYLKADAVVMDFSHTLKPSWENITEGINNLMELANEGAKFSQRSFAEFSLSDYAEKFVPPQLILKPRALHCGESTIAAGNDNYPAALFDFALMSFYAFKLLHSNKKIITLAVECSNQFEAQWWNELCLLTEEFLKIPAGSIKIILGFDSVTAMASAGAMISELRTRIVALHADFKGKIFNDLKLLRKKAERIVAERKSINIGEASQLSFAQQITATSRKYNLEAFAGLCINAAGQFTDYKDVSIAKYEEELTRLINAGFDAFVISHPGYIEFINEKLEPGTHAINSKPDTITHLPDHSQKISMMGLRDNIRTAITFMHAWNQGTASAVFDNRWEDVQTFEIIRAQIYQWVRNSVHIATGERINSRLITTLILEESEKLQEEIRTEFAGNPISEIHTILNTYTQAALDVEQLFLKDELDEYFGHIS